jgi:hypothetical protein
MGTMETPHPSPLTPGTAAPFEKGGIEGDLEMEGDALASNPPQPPFFKGGSRYFFKGESSYFL